MTTTNRALDYGYSNELYKPLLSSLEIDAFSNLVPWPQVKPLGHDAVAKELNDIFARAITMGRLADKEPSRSELIAFFQDIFDCADALTTALGVLGPDLLSPNAHLPAMQRILGVLYRVDPYNKSARQLLRGLPASLQLIKKYAKYELTKTEMEKPKRQGDRVDEFSKFLFDGLVILHWKLFARRPKTRGKTGDRDGDSAQWAENIISHADNRIVHCLRSGPAAVKGTHPVAVDIRRVHNLSLSTKADRLDASWRRQKSCVQNTLKSGKTERMDM